LPSGDDDRWSEVPYRYFIHHLHFSSAQGIRQYKKGFLGAGWWEQERVTGKSM